MSASWEAGGLFEKLLGPLPGGGQPADLRWVGDPVRTHLGLLLNTRAGTVENLPDFGMPDISSFFSDYPASVNKLRLAIQQLIEKYEPRLSKVRVQLVEAATDEFRVSFLISGESQAGPGGGVQYKTTISGTGHAAVR